MKKLVSGLLAAAMCVTLVACAGGETATGNAGGEAAGSTEITANGDMPVINFTAPSVYDMTDAPMVQDAMNEILAERYGIQVQLNFINIGSWQEQSNLLLTGDEADVICYFPLPLNTYVVNGQCLDLTDYVAGASDDFKALFSEDQLKGCQINGKQYVIPNLRNYGNIFVLHSDAAKLAELGINKEDIKTYDDVENVLKLAHEKFPDIYTIVPVSNATFCHGLTWDGLGDQNYIGVIGNCGQDTTVMDIFELPDFKEFCNYTHRWYEAGYMMGDALSNQDTGLTLVQNGSAFCYLTNRGPEDEPEGIAQSLIIDAWSDSTNISALTYGINALSSDPDNSWKLLQALYTDSDLATLLIDGIEGTHYEVKDGMAVYPEGITSATSTYGNGPAYWAMPYANGVPPVSELGGADFFDKLIQFNKDCTSSVGAGFVLDTDAMGITDEYSACINVKDKYYNGLMNGILDPETVMAQAHQEMVDAGIEKIIEAKQAELDKILGQ